MSDVILYHHALGLTDGIRVFADELRAAGHGVTVPDLYDGTTFDALEQAVAHAEDLGFENIVEAGVGIAAQGPTEVVYAGFSLGALIAHKLAQTRPGARGAVLYHYGDVPFGTFADTWPAGVSVQFHIAERDEWREEGVVEDFIRQVRVNATADMFEYPGSTHVFTDSSLPEYEAESAALVLARTLEFLSAV